MPSVVNLPVGGRPGWELNDDDMAIEGATFHSIPDSRVLLQSLKQSRENWISSTFPKFSTRSRGKQAEIPVPQHNLKFHGKFELHVEPHVYHNTTLYEVRYLPQASPAAAAPPPPAQGTTNTTPTSPLLDGSVVTTELLTMVTEAAASNPEISRLLQLAHHGKANPEELQTLSQFIRSLANNPQISTSTSVAVPITQAVPQPAPVPLPVRAFDIVIEYHERPGDRWRIPRTTAYCERIRVGERYSVRLTLQLPFPKETVTGVPESVALPPQIVQMHWAGLHENTANMLIAWCGGEEKMAENWRKMQEIKQPKRTFLPYQLPEGDWLSRVQAAVAPSYTMKSIKPANADSTRTRRRSTQRRQSKSAKNAAAASTAVAQPAMVILPTNVASTSQNTPAPPGGQPLSSTYPPTTPPAGPSSQLGQWHSPPSPAPTSRAYVGAPLPQYTHAAQQAPAHIPRTSLAAVLAPAPAFAPLPHVGYYVGAPPPRRSRSRSRSSSVQPVAQQGRSQGLVVSGTGASGWVQGSGQRVQASSGQPQAESASTSRRQDAAAPVKRRRSYQRKSTQAQPVPIACRSCGQTDVPLMMGGRFCRPCIDAGRADESIPEVTLRYPPAQSTAAPAHWAYMTPASSGAGAPVAAPPQYLQPSGPPPLMTHAPLGSHPSYAPSQTHGRPDMQP